MLNEIFKFRPDPSTAPHNPLNIYNNTTLKLIMDLIKIGIQATHSIFSGWKMGNKAPEPIQNGSMK
jgi:hypothetical protein